MHIFPKIVGMAQEKATPLYKKGDKILCFEPDPVKQPVIYFSAIMVCDWRETGRSIALRSVKK